MSTFEGVLSGKWSFPLRVHPTRVRDSKSIPLLDSTGTCEFQVSLPRGLVSFMRHRKYVELTVHVNLKD